jgi:hypothetical protein
LVRPGVPAWAAPGPPLEQAIAKIVRVWRPGARSVCHARPAPETGQATAKVSAASGLSVALDVEECADLRNCLAGLPEPRKPCGLLYPVAVMAAALLGGADSVTAIYRWAAYAPEEVLLALGCRHNRWTARRDGRA